MKELSTNEKYAIVSILYQIMNADGIVHPKEEEYMNKVYIELGINVNDICEITNMNYFQSQNIIKQMSSSHRQYALSIFESMAESDGYVHPQESAIIEQLFK